MTAIVKSLGHLKGRGLCGIQLTIGDKNRGMLETIPEVFPNARYQRSTIHFYTFTETFFRLRRKIKQKLSP